MAQNDTKDKSVRLAVKFLYFADFQMIVNLLFR